MIKQRFKKTKGHYIRLYTDYSGVRLNNEMNTSFYATVNRLKSDEYMFVVKESKCNRDNEYSDVGFIEVLPHKINFQEVKE